MRRIVCILAGVSWIHTVMLLIYLPDISPTPPHTPAKIALSPIPSKHPILTAHSHPHTSTRTQFFNQGRRSVGAVAALADCELQARSKERVRPAPPAGQYGGALPYCVLHTALRWQQHCTRVCLPRDESHRRLVEGVAAWGRRYMDPVAPIPYPYPMPTAGPVHGSRRNQTEIPHKSTGLQVHNQSPAQQSC